jgi:hypothetical protein
MKQNMGYFDRGVRFVIAAIVAGLYFTGHLHGLPLILLGTVSVAFLLTGSIGWCPLYLPIGYSTVDGIRIHGVLLSEILAGDSVNSPKG